MEEAAPVWPGPALVVLAGAAGSGKSTWAAQRYRASEIVSSDALRAAVGSGPYDLDASEDAFALLDQIVAARLRRGLTTVVDTLGLDPRRRVHHLAGLARRACPRCWSSSTPRPRSPAPGTAPATVRCPPAS
ncbi:hypothetical protein GCM10022197_32240 [Microlunatus spumicola]|uniref:AAA domain-containing protein n=1 Tax=Microlunatus spumicola TaxID=81499 RepID=A0ABP6XVK5_9ACTN